MATATNPKSRMMRGITSSLLLSIALAANQAESLMNGAPSMACTNLRPLHGFNLAKPASASQFFVSQSGLSYKLGQNITVDLVTQSSERHFRGFILQAYDPSSGAKIGHFEENTHAQSIDSCSAATHRNNQDKKEVKITWIPSHLNKAHESPEAAAHHQVRFRASIVVSYAEFYTGFESSV